MVTMKGFSDSSSPTQDPPPEGSSEEPSSEQTPTELPVHTVKPTASATGERRGATVGMLKVSCNHVQNACSF